MPFRLGPYLAESTVGMGVLGAIISGTNAIAKNAERVRTGVITPTDASLDVGKEALKNGIVTATTFVVVASIGGELVASVGLTLMIGTTLKYVWDRGYDALEEERRRPINRRVMSKKRSLQKMLHDKCPTGI